MGADSTREAATCAHPPSARPTTPRRPPADQYATRHDPFVYFHSIIDDPAGCDAHVVPLTRLAGDLGSVATTPNFTFITPNLCNDGHDASCANGGPGGLTAANAFLKTLVPELQASPAFRQDGLIAVIFDEGVGRLVRVLRRALGPQHADARGHRPRAAE